MGRVFRAIFRVFIKVTGFLSLWLFFTPRIRYEAGATRPVGIKKGSFVAVTNHFNAMDYLLMLLLFWGKYLRVLTGKVMYNCNKLVTFFLNALGAIVVDQSRFAPDFINNSLDALDKGDSLLIFPEGHFSLDGRLQPFEPTAILLALKTQLPLVPVYHTGSYRLFGRTDVIIGEDILVSDYCDTATPNAEQLKELTRMVEAKMEALKARCECEKKARVERAKRIKQTLDIKKLPLDLARLLGGLACRIFWFPKFHYSGNAPHSRWIRGKAMIICNHKSLLDPPLLAATFLNRRISIVAAKEMVQGVAGKMMKALSVIPVDRSRLDMDCIRECIKRLNDGRVVAIFPEGQLDHEFELLPFKEGAAMMAIQSGAPIIPVCFGGNTQPFQRMEVIVGEPIVFCEIFGRRPSMREIESINRLLEERMGLLQEELWAAMSQKSRSNALKNRARILSKIEKTNQKNKRKEEAHCNV